MYYGYYRNVHDRLGYLKEFHALQIIVIAVFALLDLTLASTPLGTNHEGIRPE